MWLTRLVGPLLLVYVTREADGPNAIKLAEVQVSKAHAHISYSRRRRKYTVADVGSKNGTYLNETLLGEVGYHSSL